MPATRKEHSNHRVEVVPEEPWRLPEDPEAAHSVMVAALERMRLDIRRHIDGTSGIYARWDTVVVCAHCREDWSGCLADDGTPACCDEGIAEHEAETAART